MKNQKGISLVALVTAIVITIVLVIGLLECTNKGTELKDVQKTLDVARKLETNQPTPTDINYSLERYNLIRRAYWVNGQRERANTLICEIEKPFGYVALFLENGACVGNFIVDGKISSLNSFLTPDSECYEIGGESTDNSIYYNGTHENDWLPDVDGSYGANDSGIFFFTPDGKYIEWTGTYLYSDIPFEIDDAVIKYKEVK